MPPPIPEPSLTKWTRRLLAAVCIICLVWLAAYFAYLYQVTPLQIPTTSYDEFRAVAVQIAREDSGKFLDLSVLVLGGLWAALIVNEKSRLDWPRSKPEIIMFVCSNALLLSSIRFSRKYLDLLASLYWSRGPTLSQQKAFADVFGTTYIQIHYKAVLFFFAAGLFSSALSVLSACLLRR
jgi:hypothetical protein